jgi:hypothetical protein
MDTIPSTTTAVERGQPASDCALRPNEHQRRFLSERGAEVPATHAAAAAAITALAEQHAPRSRAINPAEPGSAAAMFDLHPGRRHPAEVVVAALLRGRAVDLPDGHSYRLGSDLTLGRVGIGPEDGDGDVLTHDLPVGDFLRLCAELSFNDLFLIGCDSALAQDAVERRRARARLAARDSGQRAPAAAT